MSDFITRLYDEKQQLEERYSKLKDFIFTDAFTKLDGVQQALLEIQVSAMQTYLKVLIERIIRLEPQSNA